MNQRVDCDTFQDQLDALSEGKLSQAGVDGLRRHAASCAECAMQLRVYEHLNAQSLSDLEDAVPHELTDSVWPPLRAQIAGRQPSPARAPRSWQRWSWPVPVLAAATLLLFLASGFLYREVRQLHERELLLVQQVADQGRRLADLDIATSMDPVARTARLAGKGVWERALSRRSSVSVSELEAMLRSVPAGTTLLTGEEWSSVAQSFAFPFPTVAGEAFEGIESGDGVQAAELLHLLGAVNIDPERRVPTARILAIARRAARANRS